MYITVCYDKAQTLLWLFIYFRHFKYLPVDLQLSALICAIIILVVLSDILPDKTHCFDYKNYNYIFQSKARKCPSIRNKILTAFAAADVLTRRV